MYFSLLEIEIKSLKDFTITLACFGYRSLFYIEIYEGKLEQIDLFWLKVYLDDKWK
jgi:hypothetical protein